MSQSEDFLSFEKALRELQLRSEELKKLVSEGEIRAYRDGDSMKFRAEDVASLNSQSEGDSNLSFADSLEDDTGMVTEQISDEDTLLAEDDVRSSSRDKLRKQGSGKSEGERTVSSPSSSEQSGSTRKSKVAAEPRKDITPREEREEKYANILG